RVVGETENAQTFLVVVFKVLAAQGALAEVFAEMGAIRAAAAVADEENEASLFIAFIDGVSESFHLGGIDSQQFLPGPFEKLADVQCGSEHACSPYQRQNRRTLAEPLQGEQRA